MIDVLVVDDQADMRLLITMTLEAAEERVRVWKAVASAGEALAALTERCPRVVVLDQMMPGGRGLDFAANLRERCPDVRILLFSAYRDSSIVAEAEAIDVACMSKEELSRLPCAVLDMAA
jgi:two-component system response regulator DesR